MAKEMKTEEIRIALENLSTNFMNMEEYNEAVREKQIVEYQYLKVDDRTFDNTYPDHPLAASNRFTRIKAADIIRDEARKIKRPFEADTLQHLHASLFDCCAAVRLSVVHSLFFSGDKSSIEHLKILLAMEKESEMVKKYAHVTIHRLQDFNKTNMKVLLIVSDNIELISEILELGQKKKFDVYQGAPDAPDIIAIPNQLSIIDRAYLNERVWNDYCGYLGELNEGGTIVDDDGSILSEGSEHDTTPLILIESQSQRKSFITPHKPSGTVYFIEQWCSDVISDHIKKLMNPE